MCLSRNWNRKKPSVRSAWKKSKIIEKYILLKGNYNTGKFCRRSLCHNWENLARSADSKSRQLHRAEIKYIFSQIVSKFL